MKAVFLFGACPFVCLIVLLIGFSSDEDDGIEESVVPNGAGPPATDLASSNKGKRSIGVEARMQAEENLSKKHTSVRGLTVY